MTKPFELKQAPVREKLSALFGEYNEFSIIKGLQFLAKMS